MLAALFSGLLLLLKSRAVRENLLDVGVLRATLQAEEAILGATASHLTFLLAATLLVGVGLPRLYVCVVAGAIFGALEGVLVGELAALGGAALSYLGGRSLLGSMVRRHLGKKLDGYREQSSTGPFWWVLYGRLVPFTNSTLLSLACGACRIPFRAFIAASAVGFVPLTLAFVLLGSGGAKGSWNQAALGLACLLVVVLLRRVLPSRGGLASRQVTSDEANRAGSECPTR